MIDTEASVIAELNNTASYREGHANEELLPGQGATLTENAAGEHVVHKAGANADTTRVVREQRNPPRSLGDVGDSPLDEPYAADDWPETVGFLPHDRARLRLSDYASADPAGNDAAWDEDGNITDDAGTVNGADAPDTFVGSIIRVIDRGTDDDFVVVEF